MSLSLGWAGHWARSPSASCTPWKSPGADLGHCRSRRAASSVRSCCESQKWALWSLLCIGLLLGQLVLLLEAISQPGPDPRPILCIPLAPGCGADLPTLQAVSVAGTSSTSCEAGPSPPSLGSRTPLLLSCSVMSNSFETPWTVACQASLSLGMLQARILEGIAIFFSNPFPSPNTFGEWLKNPPATQDTQVQSLGQEDLLEEEMATHSSILAWEIPWTEEPGGLQSMGSQRGIQAREIRIYARYLEQ